MPKMTKRADQAAEDKIQSKKKKTLIIVDWKSCSVFLLFLADVASVFCNDLLQV